MVQAVCDTNKSAFTEHLLSKVSEFSDNILTPYISVTSEKWYGGHT